MAVKLTDTLIRSLAPPATGALTRMGFVGKGCRTAVGVKNLDDFNARPTLQRRL
jgi:hypothetical protein